MPIEIIPNTIYVLPLFTLPALNCITPNIIPAIGIRNANSISIGSVLSSP